jgi:hypothetical protein
LEAERLILNLLGQENESSIMPRQTLEHNAWENTTNPAPAPLSQLCKKQRGRINMPGANPTLSLSPPYTELKSPQFSLLWEEKRRGGTIPEFSKPWIDG